MATESEVIDAANIHARKDEASLEVLLGMIEKEIERDPAAKETAFLEPKYEGTAMGPLDDLKRLGLRILKRWNKELNQLVCGGKSDDSKDRQAILNSLGLGEAAMIAAVAGALLSLGVFAPLAAAMAPLIVKRFIAPAKDELCEAWGEAIKAGG